jgi:hypothetical protein
MIALLKTLLLCFTIGLSMAVNLRTIGPRSGGALFTIGAQEYKRVVTNQRFEYNTAQDDETTFGDEPNPKFGEGPSIGRVAFAGILKEGDLEAGPMLPLPQGVSVTQVYSTGNSLAYTANFSRLVVERSAMGKGILAGEAVIISAIVKTWNTTT